MTMGAFIASDGSVTGSIHWDELRDAAKRRDQEGVTDEGWARVDQLIKDHDDELAGAASEAQQRAKDAAQANEDAGAISHEPVAEVDDEAADEAPGEPTKAELQEQLRERGLPTTGNKAELQERLNESEEG